MRAAIPEVGIRMRRASLLVIAVLPLSVLAWAAAAATDSSAAKDGLQCVLRGTARRATPLILVHGNGSDDAKYPQHRWDDVIKWMQSSPVSFADYDVYDWCHDTSLPIGFSGTTGNAKQLADFIDTAFPPGQQVMLLAHSRGGLVCRAYMNHNNQGDRVLKLITLGTPHHGSPLAVPDWARVVVKGLYDELYRPGSGLFDTTRTGTLDLAWDNMDAAVQREKIFGRPLGFASTGTWCLSPDDFNCPPRHSLDETQFLTARAKRENGTLADLNARERYAGKIVAFAAYDPDLSDNRASAIELAFRNAGEHDKLKWATMQLCRFHECLAAAKTSYLANDGLVPLPSALFLDIAKGDQFATRAGDAVQLDDAKIEARRLVSQHHIVSGDHLDLLELRDGVFKQTLYREIAGAARQQASPTTGLRKAK